MKTFSIVSATLAIVTILAISSKHNPEELKIDPKIDDLKGLAYEEISVDGMCSCNFYYDKDVGTEFRMRAFGSPQARLAYDEHRYWFWIKGYDPRRYYFCPSSKASEINLIPPFRPSFSRWIINQETDGNFSFSDGQYTVEMTVKDGAVTRQRYTTDGLVEAEIRVVAFQSKGGMKFPAIATLELPKESVTMKIYMGDIKLNPESKPDTTEPKGLVGRPLAP